MHKPTGTWHWPHWLALLLGLALASAGLWQLRAASDGLTITSTTVDAIPITVFRPAGPGPFPVVVVGHGFAGSQQLMHPFAVTLARNGMLAVTFDFPGHGRNRTPLAGQIATAERTGALLAALTRVVVFARTLPDGDGRLALLGHSMAGDITARYARSDEGVDALVAVSPYLSEPMTAGRPARVLFIYGGLEPDMLVEQGRKAIAPLVGGDTAAVLPDHTYGAPGSANTRRLVIAEGVEHIGVLFSATSLDAARDWLRGAFALPGSGGFTDARGPWFALYVPGMVLSAWPLSRRLPRVVPDGTAAGAGLGWRRLLPVAILPALFTPLILMPMPTDFLAIAIGDYIALHFALYGLLTALGLWLAGGLRRPALVPVNRGRFVLALVAVALFAFLALTLPTDRFIASFVPGPQRLVALLALFAGALPWALADEWLTRGPRALTGAYPLTKLMFLISLMLAVALNLDELFFLVLVIPAILVLFVVYGLFSRWVFRRTGHPGVAAVTNALAFAGAVAVTFPVLG